MYCIADYSFPFIIRISFLLAHCHVVSLNVINFRYLPFMCIPYHIKVNASDSRGKADAKISKGIGGSNANSIKELVSNEALSANMDRFVLLSHCVLN